MKSIIIRSLLAVALLVPFTTNAAMINGDIGITGALLPSCTAGGACTMNVADGLDFLGDVGFVVFANADFNTVAIGSAAAMTDFVFNPFANVDPLWSVGGFQFALTSLVIVGQTSTSIELRGMGTISGNGYDPTAGAWSLSADTTNPNATFGWSSTTLAPVPEPGILMLLGMGLIGGLGARRLTRS